MITLLKEKKILCRTLLFDGRILSMRLVDLSVGGIDVTPFSVETPATVFEPRPVAVVRADAITDFLLDDLEMLMKQQNPLSAVNGYLASASLYPQLSADAADVALLCL